MGFSKVTDPVVRIPRQREHPLVDGESIIQQLGYLERKIIRLYWITNEELQTEIDLLETEADEGWIIDGEPARTPIQDPLNLYNVVINMKRLVATS